MATVRRDPESKIFWLWWKEKGQDGKWRARSESLKTRDKTTADIICAKRNEDNARIEKGLEPLNRTATLRANWWSSFKAKMASEITVSLGAHGQKKASFLLGIFEKLFSPSEMSLDDFKKGAIGSLYAAKRLAGQPATNWCGSKKKIVNRPIMVSTLKTEISYLSPLFEKASDEWSEETGILVKNPFKNVKVAATLPGVKEKKEDPKYMPFSRVVEFFAECRRRHGVYGEFMMKVFYYTGVRLNEGRRLRVEDIDLESGRVKVRGTKTSNAERYVDFPDAFRAEVNAYAKMAGPGPLLRHENGGMMPTSTIQHRVKKAFKAIGLPWAHVHTLRHCYTSHRLDNGDSLIEVRDAVGHGNIATTNIYAHRGAKRQQVSLSAAPQQQEAAFRAA